MPEENLINFIKKKLAEGVDKEVIRKALLGAGYSSVEVEEAFKLVPEEEPRYEVEIPKAEAELPKEEKEEVSPYQPQEEKAPTLKSKIFRKKFLLPLIILVALVSIAGASSYFYNKIVGPDPISLLPQETAFYFRIKISPEDQQIKNLKVVLNKFPYYEQISQKFGEEFEKLKEEDPLLGNLDLKNLDFTISNELILAFISPLEKNIEELPLILIFPNPDLKKLEKLVNDIQRSLEESEDWKTEEETYKGRVIIKAIQIVKTPTYHYLSPPTATPLEPVVMACFAFTNGHLFVAPKSENIKKIIDLAEDQKITNIFKKDRIKNITSNSAYKKIKKYLPKDYVALFYGEFDWSKILNTGEIEPIKETKILSPFFASLRAAALDLPFLNGKKIETPEKVAFAGAIIAEKDKLKSESYSLDLRKKPYSLSPFSFENSLANSIPEKIGNKDIAFYFEGRNLNNSFEQILSQRMTAEEKKEFDKALKNLKESLGVDLKEDILSLFEKNYAFFAAAESTGEEIPSIGLLSEIDDENKVKENLLKIKIPKNTLGLGDIFGISGSRLKAKDARTISDMSQIRMPAEINYMDEGSYSNVNCYQKYIKTLCDDIKEQVGSPPVIHASRSHYCAYTKLNEPGFYYCIDSSGEAQKTYINPEGIGYCTGTTFVCPKSPGTSPLIEAEEIGFTKEVVGGFDVYSLPLSDNFGLNFSIKDKKLIFTPTKQGLVDILNGLSGPEKKLKDSNIFTEQFKGAPKNISSISCAYPYGFLGITKYISMSFYLVASGYGTVPESEMEEMETITSAIDELLDKGVAPYLKVLKSAGSYSYSPEKGLTVNKGKLIIEELPASEKKTTEDFWKNFKQWSEEKLSPLMYGL